ncbi:hypothetical protein HK097_010803 [Rhizophlyctis rosea]|uniref:Uncharacterized protein n=1 Tax=Rhizophlyctis rosea TaxID=64517 RepID=A0AAD5SF17_9FUNG|nr:hypothetical protein HK097_010803 [Rhizophlyctis rosea]
MERAVTDALRCLKDLSVKILVFHTSSYFTPQNSSHLLIALTETIHLLISQIPLLTTHQTATAFRYPPTISSPSTDLDTTTADIPEIIAAIITTLCRHAKVLAPAATYILIQFIRDSAQSDDADCGGWEDFSDDASSRARRDREKDKALRDVMCFDAAYYYCNVLEGLLDGEMGGAGGFGSNPCITGPLANMCFSMMEDFILRGPGELACRVFQICSKMQAILPRTAIRLDQTVIDLVDRCLEAAQRSRPMEKRRSSRYLLKTESNVVEIDSQ